MPEVSIIIPSYNHAAYLRQAVMSALCQEEVDLECIVVDDGSQDRSLEILQEIVDPRLQVIAQENRGAHAAINRGISAAAGNWISILNSDDLYLPQRLQKALDILRANPTVGLVGSYIQVIDTVGNSMGIKHGYKDLEPWLLDHQERSFRNQENLYLPLLTENYLATTSNMVFSKAAYDQVGVFRPLRYMHDWDFILRLITGWGLQIIPEPLMQYRVHGANTISRNRAEMLFELCWIVSVHLPHLLKSPRIQASFKEQPERLMYSIYTGNMDTVLASFLAMNLAEQPETALALLQSDNPLRGAVLEYISDRLQQDSLPPVQPSGIRNTCLWGMLRKIKRFVLGG